MYTETNAEFIANENETFESEALLYPVDFYPIGEYDDSEEETSEILQILRDQTVELHSLASRIVDRDREVASPPSSSADDCTDPEEDETDEEEQDFIYRVVSGEAKHIMSLASEIIERTQQGIAERAASRKEGKAEQAATATTEAAANRDDGSSISNIRNNSEIAKEKLSRKGNVVAFAQSQYGTRSNIVAEFEGGVKVDSLIDSGSFCNIMREDLYRRLLNAGTVEPMEIIEETICGVYGEGPSLGRVDVPTKIDGRVYRLCYRVLPCLDVRVLIGDPLLDQADVLLRRDGPLVMPHRCE